MNNGLGYILAFVVGGTIGAVTTYICLKDKLEAEKDEEIQAVRDYYSTTAEEDKKLQNDISEYEEIIESLDYSTFGRRHAEPDSSPEESIVAIKEDDILKREITEEFEILTEDRFGDLEGYGSETLTYYAIDDVLTHENDEQIPNSDELIGDALHHFGENSNDPEVVYIRNHRIEMDFEIIFEDRSYHEYVGGDLY